ncbi:hypothetical protein EN866_19345 [Mesorhizobium sp. M2D.F.Ca.ET.223.01.1.1]|uniref:hypothetical protein n=1 Tax=unclassified Mesorhizobium TaxID=325217 RepID=UPI000FCC82E6|nr:MULTISPECIES: hypothetical protein [unclassified Mesorhizobium]TGP89316.1 hypothetical protein EN864_19355 [bacterium M00.F.Ca.ET.221.01.1.1]TGP94689.1 hypothetical protein EN865_15225 [bacterium M00.F.Ca.ET.222.01.1.1]RVD58897.1 hypothetical protein EN783_14770 [Mesorhizobium sp. M2D.F.Ca.ET.140.01.1.1]TGP27926.1 hypothetical protein EN875_033255 [Mesorhizobium sp. M2D.F.Ca.ET.232.01.1.1]TGP75857.1 hypothetical protein EN867_15225 [Mesorhizobium sp. M2D.F.Ca.ET.224.01.1.1]
MSKESYEKFGEMWLSAMTLEELRQLKWDVKRHWKKRRGERIRELHAELLWLGETVDIDFSKYPNE